MLTACPSNCCPPRTHAAAAAVTALFVPAALRQAAGASAAVAGNMATLYTLSDEFRSIEAPSVREFKLLQALEGTAGSYPVATASALSALRNLLALAVANGSYVATGNLAASYAGDDGCGCCGGAGGQLCWLRCCARSLQQCTVRGAAARLDVGAAGQADASLRLTCCCCCRCCRRAGVQRAAGGMQPSQGGGSGSVAGRKGAARSGAVHGRSRLASGEYTSLAAVHSMQAL